MSSYVPYNKDIIPCVNIGVSPLSVLNTVVLAPNTLTKVDTSFTPQKNKDEIYMVVPTSSNQEIFTIQGGEFKPSESSGQSYIQVLNKTDEKVTLKSNSICCNLIKIPPIMKNEE